MDDCNLGSVVDLMADHGLGFAVAQTVGCKLDSTVDLVAGYRENFAAAFAVNPAGYCVHGESTLPPHVPV